MNIEEQFNLIAKEYDANRKKFIPCFDEFYEYTTKFIASNIETPKQILDLGAGTGLLSYFWFQHFPKSEYVLVDIADDMLNIARDRFSGLENVSYEVLDYSKEFPNGKFDIIDGIFVNYDQFCADSSEINTWFDSYWEHQLKNSGLTAKDIELWKERRKLDIECSVEEEMDMLRKCNFKEVKCIYSNQKFSVIVAIK